MNIDNRFLYSLMNFLWECMVKDSTFSLDSVHQEAAIMDSEELTWSPESAMCDFWVEHFCLRNLDYLTV